MYCFLESVLTQIPVTVMVTITYQTPSMDDAINTIINFVILVDETSINCEKNGSEPNEDFRIQYTNCKSLCE